MQRLHARKSISCTLCPEGQCGLFNFVLVKDKATIVAWVNYNASLTLFPTFFLNSLQLSVYTCIPRDHHATVVHHKGLFSSS